MSNHQPSEPFKRRPRGAPQTAQDAALAAVAPIIWNAEENSAALNDPYLLNVNPLCKVTSVPVESIPAGTRVTTDTPNFGNCFPIAVSRQLEAHGILVHHIAIRAGFSSQILQNQNEFRAGCLPETPFAFASRTARNEVYAEDQNIIGTALFLKCEIVVFEETPGLEAGGIVRKTFRPNNININNPAINIHCTTIGRHFERVVPSLPTPVSPISAEANSPPSARNCDSRTSAIETTLKRTHTDAFDESSDEADLPFPKTLRIMQLPSPPAALPLVPQEPPAPPPSPPPPAGPVAPVPVRRFTLESLNNTRKRPYVVNVPYDLSFTAESSKKACLEPAPVIGFDRKATQLSFEIASWDVMWAGLNAKTRREHETAISVKIHETGMSREELLDSGPRCSGMTLQIGDFWYSLACLYDANLNVGTAGPSDSKTSSHAKLLGLQGKCRGCMAHHNTLNLRLRATFDIETALRYKAAQLNHHKEWTRIVSTDVSYSLVLRVLRNGGFIHLRTQADVNAIRKPLTKDEQVEHLTWIKARTHHGFRTGAELILLTEAGLRMISFDRSDSNKKIDEIGQTVIADSWGFNRLSNSLSEIRTDELLREILAGDYAEGDAAFERRNGGGEWKVLSRNWEDAIEKKWKEMSVKHRTQMYYEKDRGMPIGEPLQDIRVWSLSEFQRFCRLSANGNGNLACEVTGVELSPETWAVDRVVNGVVVGISGEYRNGHCLFMHKRLNDMKEADGRKVFATVETMRLEMQRRHMVQADFRIATQLILREYLNQIRAFRNSQAYRDNMDSLAEKRNGH